MNSNLFHKIFDAMVEGVLSVDAASGKILFHNLSFIRMWGISPVEMETLSFDSITRKMREKMKVAEEFQNILELTDGSFIERRELLAEIDEKIKAKIYIYRDVTSEQLNSAHLKTQKNVLESIFNSIPYSIFWKDAEGRYLGCNNIFAKGAGLLDASQIIGKNDYDMPWSKEESDSFRENDRKIMAKGEPILNLEETIMRADGIQAIVLTSKVPLKENNIVTGIIGIFTEITEFRNNQNKLKEQEALLINASQMSSIGQMAAGIAHEINNPLSIIKMSLAYLNKLVEKDKLSAENFKEVAKEIDDTVHRISNIIHGLRNLSRKANFEKLPFTYKDVLGDVLSLAKERFRLVGITLKETGSPEAWNQPLCSDRIQISQVIINLLNNSFDAIEEFPECDKWVEIEVKKDSENLILSVTDCGKGIPLTIRQKMFQPFYTTKPIGKGTGIGLSISKSLIEKLGGTFRYDETSENTKFEIIFKY